MTLVKEGMMKPRFAIVDRGRGPQLSNSRITVQDLVPYFQRNCTYQQIQEAIPLLHVEEIALVERYIQEHYQEVMEQDRQIRERNARRITPPNIEAILHNGGKKMEALRERFRNKQAGERNGDHASR
jgi:hypothetical protein